MMMKYLTKSNTFLERLYSKPVLTQGAVNETRLLGDNVTFSCEFLSDLHPYVYWLFLTKDQYGLKGFDFFNDSKVVMVRVLSLTHVCGFSLSCLPCISALYDIVAFWKCCSVCSILRSR